MNDAPRDPTDARDERIAARLEAEPLDDLTRARLVRTAMAASEPGAAATARKRATSGSRLRWLGVAAAIVLVLAVGVAVFARTNSDSAPTAARASRPLD